MDADSSSFSVFLTALPWVFFFLWLVWCQGDRGAVGFFRFSRSRALISFAVLLVIQAGLLYLILSPRALGAVAARAPARTSKRLVPPSAAIADPPTSLPIRPGRGG